MAQVKPEHARKRLGLRTPKAVASAGIAAMLVLGAIGVFRTHAPALVLSSAPDNDPQIVAYAEDDGADGAIGEPLLLSEVVVHIDGAVANPGVYELAGETVRICDAVDAAGGLTDDADTSATNLAQPISDGMKIHIPVFGEVEAVNSIDGESAGLINLNTASQAELMELPGVGEATARAILENRDAFGAFTSVDDLLRVSGIGEKKLEKIRPYVCV